MFHVWNVFIFVCNVHVFNNFVKMDYIRWNVERSLCFITLNEVSFCMTGNILLLYSSRFKFIKRKYIVEFSIQL